MVSEDDCIQALQVALGDQWGVLDEPIQEYVAGSLEEAAEEGIEGIVGSVCPLLADSGVLGDDDDEQELFAKKLLAALGVADVPAAPAEDTSDQPTALLKQVNISDNFAAHEEELAAQRAATAARMVQKFADEEEKLKNPESMTEGEKRLAARRANRLDEAQKAILEAKKRSENAVSKFKPVRRHPGDGSVRPPTSEIRVHRFTVDAGGKELLTDATLHLLPGERYGLIGRNGIGKTTLLRALCNGDIDGIPKGLQILHVEQEASGTQTTVLDTVLAVDEERTELLERAASLENSSEASAAAELQKVFARQVEIESDQAEAVAAELLAGLGFTSEEMRRPVASFSGGWRMRVSLAQALFCQPDVLMLDEPNNFLDINGILWLETFLKSWSSTVLVVSHDRFFLNAVATRILLLKDRQLEVFRGDYDSFEKTRAERQLQQKRQFESQQAKRKHIQEFIDKFRYNAKRAPLVQSRIKALQRMEVIEDVINDPEVRLNFPNPENVPPPIIQCTEASFGYSAGSPLLKNVEMAVDMQTRIAIIGRNGAGKTTLIKLLTGEHSPTDGSVSINSKIRIARFTQHHVEALPLHLTPLEALAEEFGGSDLAALRAHLAGFGVVEDLATQPMYTLSGGQKSRVAFARMMYKKPHILFLDEPSSHLDMDTVSALIMALNEFTGGVVLVSHDQHFITSVCDQLWTVQDGEVKPFEGDFEQYRKLVENGRA